MAACCVVLTFRCGGEDDSSTMASAAAILAERQRIGRRVTFNASYYVSVAYSNLLDLGIAEILKLS